MDLRLYLDIVWRFRMVAAAGAALAVAVGILSVATPTLDGAKPGLSHRAPTMWQSESLLLVTEKGFPWGRSTFSSEDVTRFADPGRVTSLTLLYAELAKSDAVRSLIGPALEHGQVEVEPRVAADNTNLLPVLGVTATAAAPESAERLSIDATRALQAYLEREQVAGDVPAADRIELALMASPSPASVTGRPSLVRPAFLVMLILIATVGLVFILENLRPRPRPELRVAEPGVGPEPLPRTRAIR